MQRDNIHKGTIARLEVDCAYWILFKCKYTTIYIAPLLFLEGRFIKYEYIAWCGQEWQDSGQEAKVQLFFCML